MLSGATYLGYSNNGILVSPDKKTLWSTSKINSAVYAYALPDVTYLGEVKVGKVPDWITFTPDSKKLYVANAHDNTVSVVDVVARKEITRIKVGQVPKRNTTAMLVWPPMGTQYTAYTEEQSKRNFERVSRLVVPGDPLKSLLLINPLEHEAGGSHWHAGVGRHVWAQAIARRYRPLAGPVVVPLADVATPWRAKPFVADAVTLPSAATPNQRIRISGMVVRTAAGDNQPARFTAVCVRCPHEGCDVDFVADPKSLPLDRLLAASTASA